MDPLVLCLALKKKRLNIVVGRHDNGRLMSAFVVV